MCIECALGFGNGANVHSKWIESTSAQSTSRGGLKWIEHLCAYGTAPDRNPCEASYVYRLECTCLFELRSVWKRDHSWLVQRSEESSSNRLMMSVQ